LYTRGKEFEVVSFDCYGTLIDWEQGMKDALASLLKGRNLNINNFDLSKLVERYVEIELEVEHEQYRKYRDVLIISLSRLLEEIGIKPTSAEERLFVETLPSWPLFPDTTSSLKQIKSKGYKIAILSNIDNDLIAETIKNMNIEFDAVITAEITKSYKPNPNHWITLLERLKIDRDRVLHVSASIVHDIRPAKNLGFKTAWINRKGEKAPADAIPDYEFQNLSQLAVSL